MPGLKNAGMWLVIALALSACGRGDACDRPQEYVYSKSGQRLVIPEGITAPDPAKNVGIPELPGERKERSNPCKVLPPQLVLTPRVQNNKVAPAAPGAAPPPPMPESEVEVGEFFKGGPTETLNAWIDAWSRADIPGYLAFYSEDYRTPSETESREVWLARRVELLESTGPADIAIRDITYEDLPLGRIMVRLVQDFKSGGVTNSVVKILELNPEDGGYRIRHEWVVGYL